MKKTIIKTRFRAFYKRNKGFTLVEILVSAVIVMLCIVVIVAMLRKGREIDITDRYRRLAKAIIASEFELPKYHRTQYQTLRTSTGTTTRTETIDYRGAESDIVGTLETKIGAEATIPATGSDTLGYVPVTISMFWSSVDGNDTITLTKQITGAE